MIRFPSVIPPPMASLRGTWGMYRVRQQFSSERQCGPLCHTVCIAASAPPLRSFGFARLRVTDLLAVSPTVTLLDVGCGEGRVSRLLKECGYQVMAIDPVEQLVSAAKQVGSADTYRIAAGR